MGSSKRAVKFPFDTCYSCDEGDGYKKLMGGGNKKKLMGGGNKKNLMGGGKKVDEVTKKS
jgi:hypothetical protein